MAIMNNIDEQLRKTASKAKGGELPKALTNDALKANENARRRAAGGTMYSRSSGSVATTDARTPSLADLYRQQYENQERQRRRALDATIKANNDAARQSMNDAYIRYMLQQRNLPQQLRASGINGGAAETTIGDMNNTYMNNRNAIALNRDQANAQAQLAFDNGLAGDYGQYLANQISLANANYGGGGSSSRRSGGTYYRTTNGNTTATSAPAAFSGNGFGGSSGSLQARITQLVQQGYTENEIRRILGLNYVQGGNGVR